MNEHNNTNTEAQAKKQRLLKVTQGEKLQLVEEKDASAFKIVNHSFSGFEKEICVVISTESTVLVCSGYSFVAVEVKV